jgi:hypothetical protein
MTRAPECDTLVRMPSNSAPRTARSAVALLAIAALTVGLSVLTFSSVAAAPAQSHDDCQGVTVSARVAASSLPGGAWSVTQVCVPPDAVYETGVLGYSVVGGLGVARYDDGHLGRIAFATAHVGPDRALTLVGVEDVATDSVLWAFTDGSHTQTEVDRVLSGEGVAAPNSTTPVPTEPATIELSITGSGTELATAEGEVPELLREFLDEATRSRTAAG